jgi:hypothetical protein
MYIRFVVSERDADSGRDMGVFQAIYDLRDFGKLYPYEEAHVDQLRQWFNDHLEKPDRFTTSKPPYHRKQNRAISWFKDSAHEHVRRVRELSAVLENHGVAVRMIKSERVGYIVYEDEHQVVAEPFADSLH